MTRSEIVAKSASLLIVLLVSGFAIWSEGVKGLGIGLVLLLPLSLIWFPDTWGNYTGGLGYGFANAVTPPALVSAMGWFLLVGLPVIVGFLLGWQP